MRPYNLKGGSRNFQLALILMYNSSKIDLLNTIPMQLLHFCFSVHINNFIPLLVPEKVET